MSNLEYPQEANALRPQDVVTPKLAGLRMRSGMVAAYPLRKPQAAKIILPTDFTNHEADRFVVLRVEPEHESRTEMEWTRDIGRGTTIHMADGFHAFAARVDLTDEGDLLGHHAVELGSVLMIPIAEVIAFDQHFAEKPNFMELDDIKEDLSMIAAERHMQKMQRKAMMKQAPPMAMQ